MARQDAEPAKPDAAAERVRSSDWLGGKARASPADRAADQRDSRLGFIAQPYDTTKTAGFAFRIDLHAVFDVVDAIVIRKRLNV